LAGPTASGKSKLAIELAKKYNGEIINADSMQVYKEFFILTSRPPKNDTKTIKHHLYGCNSVKKIFSTGHWLEMVEKKIKSKFKQNKTPIIVGGSGLYFKALTDGLVKIPDIPKKLRKETRLLQQTVGQRNFFDLLIKLDPICKSFISPNDSQRSMRAYEVKKFTGKSLYSFIKNTKSKFEKRIFTKLFIKAPKDWLHNKIDKRVESMFKLGAVDEVKNFIKLKVNKDLSPNKIIGIKEIKDYLNKKITLTKAKEQIKVKTRQYAKRQFTWARGHMRTWKMIYSANFNDLLKKAINKIS